MTRAGVGNLLHLKSQIVRLLQYETQREPQNYRQVQKLQLFRKRFLYLPPKGATTGGSKSAGCRPLDLGNQKSLTDCTQTKFQSDFSESFQCIVSNRITIEHKSKTVLEFACRYFLHSRFHELAYGIADHLNYSVVVSDVSVFSRGVRLHNWSARLPHCYYHQLTSSRGWICRSK